MKKGLRSVLAIVLVIIMGLQMTLTGAATSMDDFIDVPRNHWAYNSIAYVVNHGIMNGAGDDIFEPDSTANRAMIVTTVYRMAGQPAVDNINTQAFPDVPTNTWYSAPIRWAKNIGIIQGYDDDHFCPTNNMPREQIALILYRYAQYLNYNVNGDGANTSEFPDYNDTPSGCTPAMKWAIKKGMLIGRDDGLLHPNDAAKRAELAVCLHRFLINDAPVTSISFATTSKQVEEGWVGTIAATITPKNAGNRGVTWTSSDSSVATISVDGTIYTHKVGTTTITVKTDDGNKTASCTLTVYSNDPFHPSNIEYVRYKNWKSIIKTNSDWEQKDILTAAMQSSVENKTFFTVYFDATGGNEPTTFEITDSLKTYLNGKEADYQVFPIITNMAYPFHLAKQYVDGFVSEGKIENESPEYYGIWAYNSASISAISSQFINNAQMAMYLASSYYAGFRCGYTAILSLQSRQLSLGNTKIYNNKHEYTNAYESYAGIADISDDLAVQLGKTDTTTVSGSRRTWRESEYVQKEILTTQDGYLYNKSFADVNGKIEEVSYGTPNSQRPDFYNPQLKKISEVKNYNITTPTGRNNLAHNIATQYTQRKQMFPDVEIEFLIDVKGQAYSSDLLNDICARVNAILGPNDILIKPFF